MKKELPKGWNEYNLTDVVFFQEGPGVRTHQFTTDGIKLLNGRNIVDNNLVLENTDTFISNEEATTKYNHFLVDEGDLIIASSGIKVYYFHKKIAFAKKEHLPLCMNTSTIRFKTLDEKILCLKYFRYFLMTPFFTNQVRLHITGSAQLNFGPTHLKKMKVILPPLETQQKIVSILEKAEETKKLRAQADELTQQLLQSIFLEMFGDPVENPKGWNTKKLRDLCLNIYGGGTPSKSKLEYYDGEIPWVTPKDMKQDFVFNSIDHISEDAVTNSSTKIIPSDSLLMVIRSGILKRKLPVAINTCEVTLNQDMKGFVFNKSITNSLFMLYYFKSYQKYLLSRVRSVTADNLEFQQIKNIDVILPQIELQNSFAAIVEKVKMTNDQQTQSSQEINILFNTLMQKAFNGELVS